MTIKRRVWAVEDTDGNVSLTRPELTPDLADGPTLAALAGAGAGNVNDGFHSYLVTFVTAAGETSFEDEDLGSVTVEVEDKTADGKVALSDIPTGSGNVTARKIYRTAANADPNIPSNYKLLATISDNSTATYEDNIADSSLTTAVPIKNTTANPIVNYNGATGAVTLGKDVEVTQQAHIADPSGGGTADTQARTAIGSIIDALEAVGILATS